jgi:hypothetical protein
MTWCIQLGGLFHLALALFHLSFWTLFGWNDELARLRPLNRGVLQVLNLRLTYLFFAFAVLSCCWPEQFLRPGLGLALCVVLAGFWWLRALEQFLFFRPRHWWVAGVFCCGALLYTLPLVRAGSAP